MSARYEDILDAKLGVTLSVVCTTVRGRVVDYVIVLLLATPDGKETIRVYDSAHGFNEMHRYSAMTGKRAGTEFHSGTLGEGMRAAIGAIKRGHHEMIEGWRSQ